MNLSSGKRRWQSCAELHQLQGAVTFHCTVTYTKPSHHVFTISTLLQIHEAGFFLPYSNCSHGWDEDLVLAGGRQSKPNIHGRHCQCSKRAAVFAPWLHPPLPPASCLTHRSLVVGTVICCSGGLVLKQLLWFLR